MSGLSLVEAEEVVAAEPAPLPAGPVEAPVASVPVQPSGLFRIVPLAAVSLAVLASFLAVVGMVVANRTVVGASLIVADARERQEQLARVGELIGEVDALRQREAMALDRLEAMRSSSAATVADVRHAVDGLKQDIAKRDQQGSSMALVRDGQSELAERISQVSIKLERIEQKISSSRQASSAAGRAPIS